MSSRRFVVVLVLACCVRSQSHRCGDVVCPIGTACAAYLDFTLCVTPDQRDACRGVPDLGVCSAGFEGTCHGGVCLPIGCGNGRIDDPLYRTDEECDDGGRISHDGCSSTCRLESPSWDELLTGHPDRNCEHAMALDVSRGTVAMFGGAGYGNQQAALYERARQVWIQRRGIGAAPSARAGTAIANDALRGRIVLFGGLAGTLPEDDTWEWDGTSWTRYAPSVSPPGRAYHAMAYDPIRGVTVLFGGSDGSTELGDTWEWNGVEWSQPVLAVQPGARARHALVYDPARGVVVMIGQRAPGAVETWAYDGAWREVSSASHPPSAQQAAVGYDGTARQVVLFGGAGGTPGTWTFDGATWSQRPTPIAPDGTEASAAAMEATGGRVIVFGGRADPDVASAVGGTWRWTGAAWEIVVPPPAARPVPRIDHAAAHDAHRGRIVMFGGELGMPATPTDEAWELGTEGWVALPAGPPARARHAMTYDAAHRTTIVFGGTQGDRDTWLWNGTAWTEVIAASGSPEALLDAAMTFDGARARVVMFGGVREPATPGGVLDETWSWDGSAWTQVAATGPRPPRRLGAAMGYDPIRREVIMFGGGTRGIPDLADTWAWDGESWRELDLVHAPPPRSRGSLVWDAARQRLVLIGGIPTTVARDVWEWDGTSWNVAPTFAFFPAGTASVPGLDGSGVLTLTDSGAKILAVQRLRWTTQTVYEACGPGDHDRDGLRGCDDPDCWSGCSPTCPPGATCAPDEARCGDGTCSTLETCHACAADCGACPIVCGDFVCAPGETCPGDCR